ncbi:MAG: hypothetical protein OHK0039_45510 [Bacteroidia bacterium]
MRRLLLLQLLLCSLALFPGQLSAQRLRFQQVLHLKNGWILRGELLSAPTDSLVVIETADRNRFVFPQQDIDYIGSEVYTRKPKPPVERLPTSSYDQRAGYYSLTQFGLLNGQYAYYSSSAPVFTASSIHGWRHRPWLQTGVGVGLSLYPGTPLMPLFFDLRSDLLKGAATPHLYAQGGYALPLYTIPPIENGEEPTRENRAYGGPLFDIGAGIKLRTARDMAWVFTVGYQQQQTRDAFNTWWNWVDQTSTFRRIGFRAGISF